MLFLGKLIITPVVVLAVVAFMVGAALVGMVVDLFLSLIGLVVIVIGGLVMGLAWVWSD